MKNKSARSVSAIVPAYNEERNIKEVLRVLLHSPSIDEIICVNDGSTDRTLKEIPTDARIHLINLRKNHGKGYAIAKGVQNSQGEIILFIDADLQFLTEQHITQLLTPLIDKDCDGSVGYPSYSNHFINKKVARMVQIVSGERAYYKKDLQPILLKMSKKGYGLELYLNYMFKDKKIIYFPLKGIRHPFKHEKQSIETVAKLQIIEGFDIMLELINETQTLPSSIKEYFSKLYLSESPQIRRGVKKILTNIKKTLLNSI